MKLFRSLTALVASMALVCPSAAQDLAVGVEKPMGPTLLRPYQGATASPIRLSNSSRLAGLIRGGKLYLTVQDAIALAIENNLELEVNRYGTLLSGWQLKRAQAGGQLRGVTSGSSQVGQAASGQGVSGSQASAGLGGGGGGGGSGGGSAVVSQIGPVTANLDPVLQNTTLRSHTTSPQVNTRQSQTTALVDSLHISNTSFQQGLLSGGYVRLNANESYLKENTPSDILNPSVAPRVYLYAQHNFLSGFGTGVNSRFIRVAQNNVAASRQTFRSQLLDLVVNVLNLYWTLVASNENLKARQRARDVAQKFFEDTQKEIRIGVVAKVDIFRAEAEVATRRQEYLIALTAVNQQENLLKNALSRTGMENPLLDAAEVIPLDKIEVPEKDDLPPLRELLATAMAKRPDIAVSRARVQNAEISSIGTANGILPQLQGFAQTYDSGLSGTAQPFRGVGPNPYFVGDLGNALGQVFRRNFPNQRAGAFFSANIGNRVSQGDYGVDQLQLRQTQISSQRDMNQILVDISNQMVALRQARARYSAAVDTRTLQELVLEKEQEKFSLGTSTFNNVIVEQRNLVTAQTSEVNALGAYAHARVGLDQILGETLEKNNVSVDEGLSGRATR